jgi:selenide, water dikinase
VYAWEHGPAIVQTVDFFTPIVDDPFLYGQIAAANAVSDIYAMGGRPLTALAIAALPKTGLDHDTVRAIFQGGFEKLREAGVALLGGHTIQDQEIKFGYAVTGAIDPGRILTNAGAKPGDALILTKPIGTGVVGTAIKFGRAPEGLIDEAVASMLTLNRTAVETLLQFAGTHACTDITGFGLVGHASEMASASKVTITIRADAVPVFSGVIDLVRRNQSGGMVNNQEHFGQSIEIDRLVPAALADLLFDPQTSGGLLASVDQADADAAVQELTSQGVSAHRIGNVSIRRDQNVVVR